MKKNIPLIGKIIAASLVLAFLAGGCWNDLSEITRADNGDGNVTITIDAGETARTLRPNDVTAATAFNKIELDFINTSNTQRTEVLEGVTTRTLTLEQGSWRIIAKGFVTINTYPYEAAYGEATVEVGAARKNVNITLKTGIFDGKPGVFEYSVGGIDNASSASLEISPLSDLSGYENNLTGSTVNLKDINYGSLDLLPGYYLLTITAQQDNAMALWNELVHIYSGQQTAASHSFSAADFKTTIPLGGTVKTGTLNGNSVTAVTVYAYADSQYVTRIASATVTMATGAWSMTVPGTFAGESVYFRLDETITTSAGDTVYFNRSTNPYGERIPAGSGGKTDFVMGTSFTWSKGTVAIDGNGRTESITGVETPAADGAVSVTSSAPNGDLLNVLVYRYPANIGTRYAFEVDAKTSGTVASLGVQYIYKQPWNTDEDGQVLSISGEYQTVSAISQTLVDQNTRPEVYFIGYADAAATISIKLNTVVPAREYTPPTPPGIDRFTAVATADGILLTVNFTGLPEVMTGIQFFEYNTGARFQTYWGNAFEWFYNPSTGNYDLPVRNYPDVFQVLFPYVQAGKEYMFNVNWQGATMQSIYKSVTATGGRGELTITNAESLALGRVGNNLVLEGTPVINPLTNNGNADTPSYQYEFMTGSSWEDETTEWKQGFGHDTSPINLITHPDLGGILSSVAGKTCFATMRYEFQYNNDDIFPGPVSAPTNARGHAVYGSFSTATIDSTPFIYPREVPSAFTATPDAEGVRLTVDLKRIPGSTENLQFYIGGVDGMDGSRPMSWHGLSPNSYSYQNDEGEWISYAIWWHNGREYDTVSIIWPFVVKDREYIFGVQYDGSDLRGEATVTAGGGLGELYNTNYDTTGLYYVERDKTVRTNGTITMTSIADSTHINKDSTGYYWQMVEGHNWNDQGTMSFYPDIYGDRRSSEKPKAAPLTTIVFNDAFDSILGRQLSNSPVFINNVYRIVYRDVEFTVTLCPASPFFTFPNFDPNVGGWFTDAFDTNNSLWLNYNGHVTRGYSLGVGVYYYHGEDPDLAISYAWYIDGNPAVTDPGASEQYYDTWSDRYYVYEELPIPAATAPGRHYGTVVVTINGVPFAQEFSFWVYE